MDMALFCDHFISILMLSIDTNIYIIVRSFFIDVNHLFAYRKSTWMRQGLIEINDNIWINMPQNLCNIQAAKKIT